MPGIAVMEESKIESQMKRAVNILKQDDVMTDRGQQPLDTTKERLALYTGVD